MGSVLTPASRSRLADQGPAPGLVGEIAAVMIRDRLAEPADAARLLRGYAGGAHAAWSEEGVALACSGAAEIAVLDDLVVVVEGRLDNLDELASQAGIPASSSPANVLAWCWRRVGAQMVDRLVGELAGFLVERRPARIYAFRDICAGRPLHLAGGGRSWWAASEWQPLLEASGSAMRPRAEWFASAFVGHSIEPRATPYVGIDMVLPGHVAEPTDAGWRQTSVARWHIPRLANRKPGAYADQFRDLFDEAVRCRIEGAGRIGFALSGGLDSTSVLASAYAVRPKGQRTALCVPLQEPAGDERVMQAHMAERCESELQWVDVSSGGPLGADGPAAVLDDFGAPPLAVNWYFGAAGAAAAQADGLRLVLDGEDGDGSLGGSKTFLADLLLTGRWRAWVQEVNIHRSLGFGSGREMLQDSLYLSAPRAWRRTYLRRLGLSLAPGILATELRDELQLEDRLQHSLLNRSWAPGRVFRLAQSEVGLPEHLGPTFTSISEPFRRRGVLLSHPWCDRRLMSFCMGLPYVHVCKGGLGKIVLREAMDGRLPPALLAHGGKADLSEVLVKAALGRERPYVEEGLRLARSQTAWFDPDAVANVEAEFQSGDSLGRAVRVAMCGWWLRWCNAA